MHIKHTDLIRPRCFAMQEEETEKIKSDIIWRVQSDAIERQHYRRDTLSLSVDLFYDKIKIRRNID